MLHSDTSIGTQDLDALRELLEEALGKAKAAEPVKKVVTHRSELAALSCNELVRRIIDARGAQSAAIVATKLNAELTRRGKARVRLERPARNGNGGNGRADVFRLGADAAD
jgi:hypothetical protein